MANRTEKLFRVAPKITWEEYELEVKKVIEGSGAKLDAFNVEAKKDLFTADGTFEVDVFAEFEALGGRFKVLVECKRHTAAVKRDVVCALYAKLQAVGAQKGMIFSTSGFQKGAITYARHHGIALVKLADGKITYMARSIDEPLYPSWVPKYASILRADIGGFEVLGSDNPSGFLDWLSEKDLGVDGEPAPDETNDLDAPEGE